jgi:hypothetical protein
MRNAEQDVSLNEGRGFIVKDEDYQEHIAVSVEDKKVISSA